MISRLVIIFLIIGSGYVFSVFALKTLAGMIALPELAGIGKIDSYIQLIIGVLGFGMQADAIRRISVVQDWKPVFFEAQTARMTLSVLLLTLVVLAWFDKYWIVLGIAPLLAASGDYGLYARGFPTTAAAIAWVRVVIPFTVSLGIAILHPAWVIWVFLAATAIVFTITNFAIARALDVRVWLWPSWKSLMLYRQTFPVGVINLCLYFFGLGVLIIAQPFYSDSALAVAFLAIKFYVIYKGAIRVMHQAFIAELFLEEACVMVDRLAMLASLFVLAALVFFPNATIGLMYGPQFVDYTWVFLTMAMAAVVFSLCASQTTHLLLIHKDWPFLKLCLGAVSIATIFLIVGSSFFDSAPMLTTGLLVGELVLLYGLVIFFNDHFRIVPRLLFFFMALLSLSLPLIVRYLLGDTRLALILGLAAMATALLIANHKWIFANLQHFGPHAARKSQ